MTEVVAAGGKTPVPVIVTVRADARKNVLAGLKRYGVDPKQDFTVIQAFSADLPPRIIARLADDPDVVSLSLDAPMQPTGVTTNVSGSATNAPYSLRATLGITSTTYTGNGTAIAVIDSGIYKTADFDKRIRVTMDFTAGGQQVSPLDPFGHGTHVAGIIGSSKNELKGIAPAAKLVSLRALGSDGAGSVSNVIAAIQWAVVNKGTYGIDIINLSLGHPIYEPAATDPLVQAVEAAVGSGLVVVVSAGNIGVNPSTGLPGYGGITSPGNAPSAITVGAVKTFDTTRRTDDVISDYSSRGPTWYDAYAKPDLVAPGHHVMSVANTSSYLFANNPYLRVKYATRTYMILNGTSMAAPTVSGTVALMIEASKKASGGMKPSPNAIKAMLMHTAFPMSDANGQSYDTLTQGAGGLNSAGAVALAESIDLRKPHYTSWLVSGVPETSVVDGETIAWGQTLVWGDTMVWGDAIYTNLPPWATDIVWGDTMVWSDSLQSVTGATNIVWNSNVIWGNNIVWGDGYDICGTSGQNTVWGDVSLSGAYNVSLSVLTLPY